MYIYIILITFDLKELIHLVLIEPRLNPKSVNLM